MNSQDADQRRWRVRAPRDGDSERWRALYQGYADFYRVQQPDTAAATVWSWIHDPQQLPSGERTGRMRDQVDADTVSHGLVAHTT